MLTIAFAIKERNKDNKFFNNMLPFDGKATSY